MKLSKVKPYLSFSLRINRDNILKRAFLLAFSLVLGKIILVTLNSEISAVMVVAASLIFGARLYNYKYPLSGSWDYRSSLPLAIKEYVVIKFFEYMMLWAYALPGVAFIYILFFGESGKGEGEFIPEMILMVHVVAILVIYRLFETSLPPFNLPKRKPEKFHLGLTVTNYLLLYLFIEFLWIGALGVATFILLIVVQFKNVNFSIGFPPVVIGSSLIIWFTLLRLFLTSESDFFNERRRFKRVIRRRERSAKKNTILFAFFVGIEILLGLTAHFVGIKTIKILDPSKRLFPVTQSVLDYVFTDKEEFRAKSIFAYIGKGDVKTISQFSEREFELAKSQVRQGMNPSFFALMNYQSEIADLLIKNGHQPFEGINLKDFAEDIPIMLAKGGFTITSTFLMGIPEEMLSEMKNPFADRVVNGCRYENFYYVQKNKAKVFGLDDPDILEDYLDKLSDKILQLKSGRKYFESCFILLGYIYDIRSQMTEKPLAYTVENKLTQLRREFTISRIFIEKK